MKNLCIHCLAIMKRAAQSDAPAESSGGGKNMNAINAKVDPIPRLLKTQEITLNFRQRTWEEIGPGELKYLPLCQTPFYMLDEANKGLLKEYKGLWSTAIYHTPKVRISNLIMLQDDLVNQGGTPMETTAFTQVCYMLKVTPTHQSQYFKLGDITNCNTGELAELTYELSDVKCGKDYSQLISIGNYSDFERLAILPAKVDKYAGYELYKELEIQKDGMNSIIKNTFISPTLLVKNNDYGKYSVNLQPIDPPIIDSLKQVTWLRNLDKISFHKVGDVIEVPIVTNIEDKPLLNSPYNDLLNREAAIIDNSGDTYLYNTEFIWPSTHRPYFSRKDNLSEMLTNINSKNLTPLNHTFFTMPPIRKANGALLKQRCSFFMEQEFSITLRFPQTAWGEDSGKEMLLDQKDAIICRPALYGSLRAGRKDEGAICPIGKYNCKGSKCPFDNSFMSLIEIMVDEVFKFQFTNQFPGTASYKITATTATKFDNKFVLFDQSNFQYYWKLWIDDVASGATTQSLYINLKQKAHASLVDRAGQILDREATSLTDFILIVPYKEWNEMLANHGITCDTTSKSPPKKSRIQHTGYLPSGRQSKIFYM